MVNANAEAQRRWRERKKQKRQDDLKRPARPQSESPFQQPFFEALENDGNFIDVEMCLDIAGIEPVTFEDDSGPKSFTGQIEQLARDSGEEPYLGVGNSLGRAEVIVGSLIDAAAELASIVNKYKRREIKKRIAEVEASDLTDPVLRKDAMAQIVRLNKLLDQLDKQVRWTFRQWKVDDS